MAKLPKSTMWSLIAALLSALVELAKFVAKKNEPVAKPTEVPEVDRAGQELKEMRERAAKHKPN